jgi:hypothetical protein
MSGEIPAVSIGMRHLQNVEDAQNIFLLFNAISISMLYIKTPSHTL